jgi:pyruvate/2-oxoglutarate dehydrogenase complex dihydrolipoamide dehydrogenase (E3) component
MLDHLLPLEDEEAVEVLLRSFKKRGIKIYTSTKATEYKKSGKVVKITLEGKQG